MNNLWNSYLTMSLHIVVNVLLKRIQNCMNVLVAKLCFSRVPVFCENIKIDQGIIPLSSSKLNVYFDYKQ